MNSCKEFGYEFNPQVLYISSDMFQCLTSQFECVFYPEANDVYLLFLIIESVKKFLKKRLFYVTRSIEIINICTEIYCLMPTEHILEKRKYESKPEFAGAIGSSGSQQVYDPW